MIEIPQSKRESIISDLMPDFTPLIDVMFMLIVFFILTANSVPYALDVALPNDSDAVTQAVEDPDMVSITLLNEDGGWKINDVVFKNENDFKDALKAKTADNKKVIIIGDKSVSMEKLLNVMTFLRKHNIEAAEIVMDKH